MKIKHSTKHLNYKTQAIVSMSLQPKSIDTTGRHNTWESCSSYTYIDAAQLAGVFDIDVFLDIMITVNPSSYCLIVLHAIQKYIYMDSKMTSTV